MRSAFTDSELYPLRSRGPAGVLERDARGGLLDRFISWLSPERGAKRAAWRAAEDQFTSVGGQRGYRSAAPSRIGNQQAGSGGADYHLEQNLDRLRIMERARQLVRDNPIAAGVVSRIRENVVGSGLKPQARSADLEWNAKAEELWAEWTSEPIDTRRLFSFIDLQRMAIDGYDRDGEFYTILRETGAVELVEADRISAPPDKRYRPYHVDGIDLDPLTAAPTMYYLAPRRADEHYSSGVTENPERQRIPAKYVLHMARRERPSQTHGLSLFSSNAEWFEQLERYIEAEIQKARMGACVGMVISSAAPMGASAYNTSQAGTEFPRFEMEPGMVRELAPGESITQVDPTSPVTQFGEFIASFCRLLGAPSGLPLELILLDFSRGSYSSVRGALTQAHLVFRSRRQVLRDSTLIPIWRWKIIQWILSGALPRRPDCFAHAWIEPGFAWLDPTKEIQAEQMALDAGLKTYAEALAGQGKDFDEVVEQRSREEKKLKAAGLVFARSTATRDPLPVQATTPAPGPAQEPEEEAEPAQEPEEARRAA